MIPTPFARGAPLARQKHYAKYPGTPPVCQKSTF
jgi:hypothetical protein